MAPLYGLVLAGGRSRRMQTRQGGARVRGPAQLERAMALHRAASWQRAFVSVRADQRDDPLRARLPQIAGSAARTSVRSAGSARRRRPAIPRRPGWCSPATCRCSMRPRSSIWCARGPAARRDRVSRSHDGLPEPLCAIWEPAQSLRRIGGLRRRRPACPRRFLLGVDTALLDAAQSAGARQRQYARGVSAARMHSAAAPKRPRTPQAHHRAVLRAAARAGGPARSRRS